jgi:hypothetical protein
VSCLIAMLAVSHVSNCFAYHSHLPIIVSAMYALCHCLLSRMAVNLACPQSQPHVIDQCEAHLSRVKEGSHEERVSADKPGLKCWLQLCAYWHANHFVQLLHQTENHLYPGCTSIICASSLD